MTVLIKVTGVLTSKPVWIWVEHIASMTQNSAGGAIIHTMAGQQYALKETPDQVLDLISKGKQAAA